MPRLSGPVRISIVVLAATTADVELALRATITWNRAYLRLYPETAPLYESGVFYARESERWREAGEERFVVIPLCFQTRGIDCDDAVAWRCAELQEQGINAEPHVYQTGEDLYHCVVRYPDGRIEDPSRILGMTGLE